MTFAADRLPVRWIALALCVLFLAPLGVLYAEDPPGEEADIATLVRGWIADLRKNEYALRERARESLRARGAEAPEVLREFRDDEDAEVARLVASILADAGGLEPSAAEPGDLGGLGRLRIPVGEPARSLRHWFDQLAWGKSAPFDLSGIEADREVALPAGELDWAALYLKLLEAADARPAAPFAAGVPQILTAGEAGAVRLPSAAAGPFVIQVESVTATRVLDGGKPPSYQLGLLVQWPDFVQLVQHEAPHVTRLEAPDGTAFGPLPQAPRMNYGIGTHQSHRAMQVTFARGEEGTGEHLGAIDVRIPVVVRHDMAELSFDLGESLPQCRNGADEEVGPGEPGTVRLTAIEAPAEGQRGPWRFEMDAVFGGDLQRQSLRLFVGWEGSEDQMQRIHATSSRPAGADGHVQLSARAWSRGGGRAPVRLLLQWFRQETRGPLEITLEDIPLR